MLGESWNTMYGAVVYSLAVTYPFWFGHRALEAARKLEQVGHRVWAMAAGEVRMLYHAWRGESEDAQRYRERVELFAVQGNTTWQADMACQIIFMESRIRAGDAIEMPETVVPLGWSPAVAGYIRRSCHHSARI